MTRLVKSTAILIAILAAAASGRGSFAAMLTPVVDPFGPAGTPTASEPGSLSSRPSAPPELPDLDFVREPTQWSFLCNGDPVLWNPEALIEANRDIEAYRYYAELFLREPTDETTRRALRERLSGVITHRMNVAQIARQSGDPSIPAEREIADYSAAWSRSEGMQRAVWQGLRRIGDPDLAHRLATCLSRQSLLHLARLKGLADRANLYALQPAAVGEGADVRLYALISPHRVREFLARERVRARRILDYAEPYVRLLSTLADAAGGGQGDRSIRFWMNSLAVEGGQTGQENALTRLDALVADTLSQLDRHNCVVRLAAEPAAQTPDDLFGEAAVRLLKAARSRCSGLSDR